MGNIHFLQLGIGLVPAAIFFVFLLVKGKALSLKKVSVTMLAFVMLLTFVSANIDVHASQEISTYTKDSKETTLNMCYALIAQGSFDIAQSLLEDYTIYGIYDNDISLIKARIEAMKGNYKKALGIANKKGVSAKSEEKEILAELVKKSSHDDVLDDYISSNNLKVKGYKKNLKFKYDDEDIWDFITDEAESIYDSDFEDAAETFIEVQKNYSIFSKNYSTKEIDTYGLTKTLEKLSKKIPMLDNLHLFRILRLKADIMDENYKDAVKRLRRDSYYDEYMIASEMLVNDLVDEKDFSEEFYKYTDEELDDVVKQLEKVKEKQKRKLSKEEYKELSKKVETAKKRYDDPLITSLVYGMEEKALNGEVNGNDAKIHMQIAKIENYCGNEDEARSRIAESMDTVGICPDASFVDPMTELIAISNGDSGDDVKNIAEYVDYALDHSSPVRLDGLKEAKNTDNSQPESTGEDEGFDNLVKNYVIETSAAVTIGSINTENFEEIEANVIFSDNFTGGDSIKKDDIVLRDCGIEIKDFTIEKIKFSGSDVILCCDNSGSMSGQIQLLQSAVEKFIADRESRERISVVLFDSSILRESGFTKNAATLQGVVDSMSSGGGTAIYDSTVQCLEKFDASHNSNRVIIVMTDGQDGYTADSDAIYENIGTPARENGITVYTVGLGSGVNTEYLKNIAEYTGGSFVYAENANDLTSFYDFIRSKMNNMYKIKYKAADTLTTIDRTLSVSMKDTPTVNDEKTYNIGTEYTNLFSKNDGVTIYGLTPKTVYKSENENKTILNGNGFKKGQSVSVKLVGNISYDIDAKVLDEYKIELTIPVGVVPDVYDVEILINGKRGYLRKEFSLISPGSEKELNFGPYKFTAASINNDGSTYTLDGNVTLNGWLHFNGEVELTGDIENGGSINMKDYSGSYVSFDSSTAVGISKFMANKGINFYMTPLGSFTLYNDQDHYSNYDEYRVDNITGISLRMFSILNLPEVKVNLLPDKLNITYSETTSLLPFQDTIFMITGEESPFSFEYDAEVSGVISGKTIGIVAGFNGEKEYDGGNKKKEKNTNPVYKKGKISNLPIKLDKSSTGFKLDTINNTYEMEFGIECDDLFGIEGISFGMGWKDLKFDMIKLGIDRPITAHPGGVPVTFRNFSLKVADMSEMEKVSAVEILKSTLEGSLDVEMLNLAETFPKVTKIITNEDTLKDMCVLSLPETTLSVNVRNMKFALNAKLMFVKTVELASAEILIGKFDFNNELLFANGEVSGLQASVSRGIKWKTDNMDLNLSGTTQVNGHSKFVGLSVDGTLQLTLDIWLIEVDKKTNGEVTVGMHFPDYANGRFVVACKYLSPFNNVKSWMCYIDADGSTGSDKNYL